MNKSKKNMFRAGLALALSLNLTMMVTPALADTVDLEIYECVGTLTENFDGLTDANELYQNSGDGVLSGTWQRSSRGANGSAEVESGAMNIIALDEASSWGTFSGVDFVFDKPLATDCIIEVSYEMSGAGYGSVFFNNLSDANAEMSNVNSIGAGVWDGGFQFITANEDRSPAYANCWVAMSGTAAVNATYNLSDWIYDGTVTTGEGTGQIASRPIGPAAYNDNGGTFVCIPGSTYDRLTFAVRQGTSTFDNISVKAYKLKSDVVPRMAETFNGKNAGAMADTKVESGIGKWVANTAWGGGFEYAQYTDAGGEANIGIRATAAWNRLQYDPGVNFTKMYENNSGEITFGFDFITPDTVPDGKVIMEWGDGFTNQYRNIPFFAITRMDDDHWAFTRCSSNSGESNSDDVWPNFGMAFAKLNKNEIYTFEGKVYPATGMTYATIKQGETIVYSGFYRNEQWRKWTEGLNLHTMSVSEIGSAVTGIIFDNFKMSAKEFTVQEPLGRTIDFNVFENDGFLETIYWGASATIASAPRNGSTDMGNALNVVGNSEGVALPYFTEAASEGIYRYTAMLYNNNLDIADDTENKENSRTRMIIDAPKDPTGYIGSLTLALLENNTVSLGTDDKISVAGNEWVKIENIIDINNKKLYLAVYDKGGKRLGVISSEFLANDSTEDTKYTIDSINSIRIRNWNNTYSGIAAVVDDMKLERIDGDVGFVKNNAVVNNASVGDALGVAFILNDIPNAASSETCIIAYYDEYGNQLISVDMPEFTMEPDSIFCACDNLTTVPAGAATAKAFIWDMSTLKPLAESATLRIVSAE